MRNKIKYVFETIWTFTLMVAVIFTLIGMIYVAVAVFSMAQEYFLTN